MEYSDKMSPDKLFELKQLYDIESEKAANKENATNGGKQDLASLLSNPNALTAHLSKLQEINRING